MKIGSDSRIAKGVVKQNYARMILAREIGKSIQNGMCLSIAMLCYLIENPPDRSYLLGSGIQDGFGKIIMRNVGENEGICYTTGGQQFILILPGMQHEARVSMTRSILEEAGRQVYRDRNGELSVSYGGGGVTCTYSKRYTEDYWGTLAGMEMDICFNLMIEGLMNGGSIQ